MTRRERSYGIQCADGECTETTWYAYSTQRECAEIIKRHKAQPWKCNRHADPDKNLRPGNEHVTCVLVATRLPSGFPDRYPYNLKPPEEREWLRGLFWVPEGGKTGSGFIYGPGFNGYASDFPEGTRLIVSAQAEIPEMQTGADQ